MATPAKTTPIKTTSNPPIGTSTPQQKYYTTTKK